MLFRSIILPLLVALPAGAGAQPYEIAEYAAERTTAAARAQFIEEERAALMEKLQAPIGPEAEEKWPGAFWTAGLINETGPEVKDALERAFASFEDLTPNMQRVVLQSANALYPDDFEEEVRAALQHVSEPKAFAIAAGYLLAHDASAEQRQRLALKMVEKFPDWRGDGRLAFFWKKLSSEQERPPMPSLEDLFTHDFGGHAVAFSLQRRDRRYPGQVMMRGTDGQWLRGEDGEILTVPQLAMSRTNMPGTISLGNTPQGLHTIVGTGTATNQFIGPTPYIWTKVPYEAPLEQYFHAPALQGEEWHRAAYVLALPPAWRGYWPMEEAYYAGMAGRSEMIMHGTTIEYDFYEGESYYPYTPSAGCLCTYEEWSPEDGRLVRSGQIDLLNAWYRATGGSEKGFMVLVEIDNQKAPVTAEEVRALVGNTQL